MAKHTQGPWEAVDGMRVRTRFIYGDREHTGMLVVDLPPWRAECDAALIAAAPDLLEACKMLLEEMAESYGTQTPIKINSAAADAAWIAVNKAEGN